MSHDPRSDRVTELEDDNQRLRRLLDARDVNAELRHRARGTLAMLRTIIRSSVTGRRSLDEYVSHLEDRLDAIGRTQATADTHGFIDLHSLVSDELFFYKLSEGDRLSLTGPTVRFRPRVGQVFALAIHELAVNAVEYGSAGRSGRVDVKWRVGSRAAEPVLTFDWLEEGAERLEPPGREGFGTEVLTRMLRYDLQAETAIEYRRTGMRCEIRMPFPEAVGTVIDASVSDDR